MKEIEYKFKKINSLSKQIKFMYVLSSIVLPSLQQRLLVLIDYNAIEP